jgi:hypothetical protein
MLISFILLIFSEKNDNVLSSRVNFNLKIVTGRPQSAVRLNQVVIVNPATSKAEKARFVKLYGQLLKRLNLLSDEGALYIRAKDLIESDADRTLAKATKVIQEAKGKVLAIDEAHILYHNELGKKVNNNNLFENCDY